jgi:hypothetical protein
MMPCVVHAEFNIELYIFLPCSKAVWHNTCLNFREQYMITGLEEISSVMLLLVSRVQIFFIIPKSFNSCMLLYQFNTTQHQRHYTFHRSVISPTMMC